MPQILGVLLGCECACRWVLAGGLRRDATVRRFLLQAALLPIWCADVTPSLHSPPSFRHLARPLLPPQSLEARSKAYKQAALGALFLMNNVHYMVWTVEQAAQQAAAGAAASAAASAAATGAAAAAGAL